MDMRLPPLAEAGLVGAQDERLRSLARSLSAEQALWVSGYFAGVAEARGAFGSIAESLAAPAAGPADDGASAITTLKVLYAGETGNAAGLAQEIARRAGEQGLVASAEDVAGYKTRGLKDERTLLFVASTHGEGEPAEPARPFFEFLAGRKAPRLEGMRFAVLALGDSTYAQYCEAGRLLDRRLAELGAARLHERVDCDVDYDADAARWIDAVLAKLAGSAGPARTAASGASPGPAAAVAPAVHDKTRPFSAPVLEHQRLTGRGSTKDTHHLELGLEGSGLDYTPGDALGVVPRNDPALVDELIDTLGWTGDEPVPTRRGEQALREALQSELEITALTPRFIEAWARLSGDASLARLDAAGRTALMAGTQLIDLVRSHPAPGVAAADVVPALRTLQPRLYSIASSSALVPGEVHLCVAPVRFSLHDRPRHGVASVHLADRLRPGDTLPVYVQRNDHFRLPGDPAVPIVMIGAGTGVAPYRAFLQHREALGADGPSWLFFGERRFRTDFLYQTEWQQWLREGTLSRLSVAFSRDRAEKVYVQHRLLEHGAQLWQWIDDGAHLYVCGDAQHMAHDVHQALLSIVAEHGGHGAERAHAFLNDLQAAGRYQKDIY